LGPPSPLFLFKFYVIIIYAGWEDQKLQPKRARYSAPPQPAFFIYVIIMSAGWEDERSFPQSEEGQGHAPARYF